MSPISHHFGGLRRLPLLAAAGLAVALSACASEEYDDRDRTVSYAELPPAVRRTVDASLNGAAIETIDMSYEDGRWVYDVEARDRTGAFEFSVAEDGTYLGRDTEDDDEMDPRDPRDREEPEEPEEPEEEPEREPGEGRR